MESSYPCVSRTSKTFTFLSSKLSEVNRVFNNVYVNTSGTTSTSHEITFGYRHSEALTRPLPELTRRAFKELADYKSRKVEIPRHLSHLQPDLGRMFSTVHNTVEKARNKVIMVKQAISDMRDVLNHIWVNLVDVAAKRSPGKFRSRAHKEFKTSANHVLVAECLITDPLNRGTFQLLLDNMYNLYSDMSHYGKNPLNDDYAQLEEFYSRWIIQIDGAVGMINWREWENGLPDLL